MSSRVSLGRSQVQSETEVYFMYTDKSVTLMTHAAQVTHCGVTASIIVARVTYKLHGLSLRANYTDRATAACRRSDCQLVRIEGATWSA
jgi:hypothetical protein